MEDNSSGPDQEQSHRKEQFFNKKRVKKVKFHRESLRDSETLEEINQALGGYSDEE